MIKNIQKGFTLIELLVVIAIIGILAGILFIAINPKEQNDKAKNTSLLGSANQEQKEALYCQEGFDGIDCERLSTGNCSSSTITNESSIKRTTSHGDQIDRYAADCGFRPNTASGLCVAENGSYTDFETARNFCEKNGGRLCLLEEIPIAQGSGCSHDNYPNWTTSICKDNDLNGVWVAPGSPIRTGVKLCETDLVNGRAAVTCCSED